MQSQAQSQSLPGQAITNISRSPTHQGAGTPEPNPTQRECHTQRIFLFQEVRATITQNARAPRRPRHKKIEQNLLPKLIKRQS